MFGEETSDQLIQEFAADCILNQDCEPNSAVFLIARRLPEATGLQVAYALVAIASSLEYWRPQNPAEAMLTNKLFKSCSVLSADLYALEVIGSAPATCSDLLKYWGKDDPYFAPNRRDTSLAE